MVAKAKGMGISAVGITDHDTIKGLDSSIEADRKYGIEVVPGVEISILATANYFTPRDVILFCFNPIF